LIRSQPNFQTRGVVFTVIGIWILDLSNNLVQAPLRVLLVDIAPPDQQNLGGSLFSAMIGLGNLVGFSIGYFKWSTWITFLHNDYQFCFSFATIVLVITISMTVVTIRETPIEKHQRKIQGNPFREIFEGIKGMPRAMWRDCAVQFTCW
jgi:solute carrier family 45, member 1/2/4